MSNVSTEITTQDAELILNAHKLLLRFVSEFDTTKRGGIHYFIEIVMANMVNKTINNVDEYLRVGHKNPDAKNIMHIVTDSFQNVLDGVKRNIEGVERVILNE